MFCIGCNEDTNEPPIINSIELDSTAVSPGGIINVYVSATDPDGDQLNYSYTVSDGSIVGIGQNVQIIAPMEYGIYNLNVIVSDGRGGEATGYKVFYVNSGPIIIKITISPEMLKINSIATIEVYAVDPDGATRIADAMILETRLKKEVPFVNRVSSFQYLALYFPFAIAHRAYEICNSLLQSSFEFLKSKKRGHRNFPASSFFYLK